jgi:hypothetical protein
MAQLFGHRKVKQKDDGTKQRNIQETDIVLNHNKITQELLIGSVIIILAILYVLFQDRNSILYCDKVQNYCQIRRESNIGFRSSRDLFSPQDIKDVIAKLNFTEKFEYGPIKLKHAGNRVYHSIYLINPGQNQIPIFTKYDNSYKNSKVQKRLKIVSNEIKEELNNEDNKIIEFNLSKAYKNAKL